MSIITKGHPIKNNRLMRTHVGGSLHCLFLLYIHDSLRAICGIPHFTVIHQNNGQRLKYFGAHQQEQKEDRQRQGSANQQVASGHNHEGHPGSGEQHGSHNHGPHDSLQANGRMLQTIKRKTQPFKPYSSHIMSLDFTNSGQIFLQTTGSLVFGFYMIFT
ncbi:hypothetical protein D3C73_1033150 [compost metagenome]